ncbi:D-alanyl-D-alanine carboxypeptidase [Streptomyces sp. BPTC-684]|uniref:D-alanyl-D-alanine carboxypeptidase n=1 Tax=Streptomyces sp. BPTC-684 TaxID=3043734 RepID=UPI0024B1133F|nr:D-alanyl-D-alanine carboxypeptidase [Streptomyces sp. BPTC-684]WHM37041.1 D-alanyl-D-alanine carboxypeptidase [Streptomyces sp. BPTC-684]
MIQLHTPNASRNQETRLLSFMESVSPGRSGRSRAGGGSRRVPPPMFGSAPRTCTFSSVSAVKKPAKIALAVAVAALLPALTAAPASALPNDDKPGTQGQPGKPTDPGRAGKARKDPDPPPATMSTVGGAQLGQPGTQVKLGAGAPVLPMELTGRSWIVADAENGQVLASHNAHWRLPPASTLKMLFADTVLPKFPKTDVRQVGPTDLDGVGEGSSLVGVKENQSYTVHDLWLGVFLRSGNDAVHVLSAMNGGVPKTVQDMQAHADDLQALDTHVVSPDGYDAPGQVSSAYDLTLFARSGLQKKDFREYCSTASAKFPGAEGKNNERDYFEIQNTNRLLTGENGLSPYKGIAGVKNGNTTNAGATFTGVAERDGRVLLVTVMNPDSSDGQAVYKEAANLLDWGFAAAGKVTPVGELVPPKSAVPTGAPQGSQPSADGAARDTAKAAVTTRKGPGSGGIGTALAIAGGVLVVVAAGVFLLNRRWPLPELVRRKR